MAGMVTLRGFREFEKKLRSMPTIVKKEVGGETEDAGRMWEQRAKQDAPVDQGLLRNQIKSAKTGELTTQVTSASEYAPWVEWGTKSRVKVPPDIAAYAATFRGGGSGGGKAKEMIYAWMKRVGVPEERQYFAFISIITKGIHPHPYFFVQKPAVEKQFINNVRRILNTEH